MNPFIEYRKRLDVYDYALSRGLSDDDYVSLVEQADYRVAAVDGVGFVQTPLLPLAGVPTRGAPGELWGKVETANVSGSHKARHLFGLMIRSLVDGRTGEGTDERELAIASCGNAALGAAVVAKAAGRRLRVFVPSNADPAVIEALDGLSATVETCERSGGELGDPCVMALDRALEAGSVAFTVQGTIAPNSIDGARTLGLELASQLGETGVDATDLYVQVGGGALGTATMDGLSRGGYGPIRLNTVQTERAHPFVAAWDRSKDLRPANMSYEQALEIAKAHPDLMVAWPEPPESIASGILDDITYDWTTLFAHQASSGGHSVLVGEEAFAQASAALAPLVSPAPDETGAASVAGWMVDGERPPGSISVALVTGARRD